MVEKHQSKHIKRTISTYREYTKKSNISFVQDEFFTELTSSQTESGSSGSLDVGRDQPMRTLNFPMFYHWHRLQHSFEHVKYNYVISEYFGRLLADDFLLIYLCAQTLIKMSDLKNFDLAKKSILAIDSLSDAQKNLIFNDSIRGIGVTSGLRHWLRLSRQYSPTQVRP